MNELQKAVQRAIEVHGEKVRRFPAVGWYYLSDLVSIGEITLKSHLPVSIDPTRIQQIASSIGTDGPFERRGWHRHILVRKRGIYPPELAPYEWSILRAVHTLGSAVKREALAQEVGRSSGTIASQAHRLISKKLIIFERGMGYSLLASPESWIWVWEQEAIKGKLVSLAHPEDYQIVANAEQVLVEDNDPGREYIRSLIERLQDLL